MRCLKSAAVTVRSPPVTEIGKKTAVASIFNLITGKPMSAHKRPLSPHLQVYNPQITSVMSILHRMSGVALALGSLGLLWVLASLSMGPEAFSSTKACLDSTIGRLAVFVFSLCLMYHLFNGVRHLFWDIGKGYDLATVTRSGLLVLALTVLSTAGLWVLATSNGGAL